MRSRKIIPVLLALVLIAAASIIPAMSYFTNYTSSSGSVPLSAAPNTPPSQEEFDDKAMEKLLTVKNDGGPPMYVRARAYAPDGMTLTYSGDGWYDGGDGWYYYAPAVDTDENTAVLRVKIGNIPAEATEGEVFNVPLIYETTPAQYAEDGTMYADWGFLLETGG